MESYLPLLALFLTPISPMGSNSSRNHATFAWRFLCESHVLEVVLPKHQLPSDCSRLPKRKENWAWLCGTATAYPSS